MGWQKVFEEKAEISEGAEALKYLNKHSFNVRKNFVDTTIRDGGKRILDLGCGDGALMKSCSHKNEVTGIDMVMPSLRKVKYSKVQGNGEFLPFKPKTFDIVVSFNTLQYVSDQDKFISEIKRVLKPKGRLIINTLNNQTILLLILKMLKMAGNEKRLSMRQLISKINPNTGFRILRKGFIPVYPNPFWQKLLGWLSSNRFLGYDIYIIAEKN